MSATFDEADCLRFDPFQGDDYGNSMQQDFGAKMVTGRGEYECHICNGPIAKSERHRVDSCRMDGEVLHARFCGLCCAAMAKAANGDDTAINAREHLFR
jgi:hypothetical protein